MSEKTTSLDPNSSQSYEAHDSGDGLSGYDNIENQQQAELNWVLFQNKGLGPTFIPNPAWVEHKQQKKDQSRQNINDIWAEHTNFVKNSGFRRPQVSTIFRRRRKKLTPSPNSLHSDCQTQRS